MLEKLRLTELSEKDIEMACSNLPQDEISNPMTKEEAQTKLRRLQVIAVLKMLKREEEYFNAQLNRNEDVDRPTLFISASIFTHKSVKKAAEMSGWTLDESRWLGQGFSEFSLSKKGYKKVIFVSEE